MPPGAKKKLKMKAISTPLIRYGKKMMPFQRFFSLTLKLRIVAKYMASPICIAAAAM